MTVSRARAMSPRFFVLVVLLALLPASRVAAQTKGKTLTIGHGVDLESLNPYWHNTTANYAVWRPISVRTRRTPR